MLHHAVQGYVDAIYVATTLRPAPPPWRPPHDRSGDDSPPRHRSRSRVPAVARIAAWCRTLLAGIVPGRTEPEPIRASKHPPKQNFGSGAQSPASGTY